MNHPPVAVLYTRGGCCLCFELRRLARRSSRRWGVDLREMDIDLDPRLAELHGRSVPVLELPGGLMLAGRASAREVEEAFRGAAGFLDGLRRAPVASTSKGEPGRRPALAWVWQWLRATARRQRKASP